VTKFVYQFEEGSGQMKNILGGKGAGLSEMARLGIPVPPGFTITTEVCQYYYAHDLNYPDQLFEEVREHLSKLEQKTAKIFGSPDQPLLVSVRSGAVVSMPGMMDTILNLGLNDAIVEKWASNPSAERFVLDSYRRLLQMFGNVVYEVKHESFEKLLSSAKAKKGVKLDNELGADDLRNLIQAYKEVYIQEKGKAFPQDPWIQLTESINAVVKSWNNERAKVYRKLNKIEGLIGTAVNVQSMVFGNLNERSATGVCFTRDPSTGDPALYGEFLINAQGEDVVAGIRTPQKIHMLETPMPIAYQQLVQTCRQLEKHYRDMQDIEFTIENEILYLLQTRSGKRTGAAAIRIAYDMHHEGVLSKEEALMRVHPNQVNQLLHKRFDEKEKKGFPLLAKGLPASPGAATGKVVFTAEEAEIQAANNENVILVREETSPEDIKGMHSAQGILTARGGMTSHAAVVARGMGKCCVSGADDIHIDEHGKSFRNSQGILIKEGDIISLDGSSGEIFQGSLPVIDPVIGIEFEALLDWSDEFRKLKIRTNADTPQDALQARAFGAEGIGLCRTEHMFFEGDRIKSVQEMILSASLEGRQKALDKILPMQKEDFIGIFQAMKGLPVTIRLLDPPLHEFLPSAEADIKELAVLLQVSVESIKEKIVALKEVNPMLGHRGCRLGITYPEITRMQTRAIMEAAAFLLKNESMTIEPEIMVPLVGTDKEFIMQKELIDEVAKKVMDEFQVQITYWVGTMIEVPRAALTAGDIAKTAQFFSFGTNDLTQMTYGFSRDDINKFLPEYLELKILKEDPFASLDQTGVGRLIKIAVEEGRKVNPGMKLGICGEHGGDPDSIEFCHLVGLDYVSCSPYRVPVARVAAARSAILNKLP
jgi:pyruvate, orthophosphate dikinase